MRCLLLVSDDADDHQIVQEAVSEISKDLVLVVLMDASKLLIALEQSVVKPDVIIVDTEISNVGSAFLERISSSTVISKTQIISFSEDDFQSRSHASIRHLSKRQSYRELVSSLYQLLK